MTNLQYLIACLTDQIDDGGASFEAAVHYHIACPHFLCDENLPCEDQEPSRKVCYPCKVAWLNAEVSP